MSGVDTKNLFWCWDPESSTSPKKSWLRIRYCVNYFLYIQASRPMIAIQSPIMFYARVCSYSRACVCVYMCVYVYVCVCVCVCVCVLCLFVRAHMRACACVCVFATVVRGNFCIVCGEKLLIFDQDRCVVIQQLFVSFQLRKCSTSS